MLNIEDIEIKVGTGGEMAGMNYVAKCKGCGCIVGVISDECSDKEQAKDVGAWIRRGLSVEQMKTEEVRGAEWMCKCEKVKRPSEQAVLI